MDIFQVREDLIDDYRLFTTSAIEPRDPRVSQHVADELAKQTQWPEPWLSLNPMFASGGSIDDLVSEDLLHPECAKIFRPKRDMVDTGTTPITLHRHQREAIETAKSGKSYVLTTGTGSGKSLAYIIPIVDHVLRQEPRQPGVQAIIVYPMNALANSQVGDLEKFLRYGYGEGKEPVTFGGIRSNWRTSLTSWMCNSKTWTMWNVYALNWMRRCLRFTASTATTWTTSWRPSPSSSAKTSPSTASTGPSG